MKLNPTLQKKYSKETKRAYEAQRLAYEISFGPIIFQVSRLMKKFGILQILIDAKNGLTIDEISEKTKLSKYACSLLMEASLTIGTVLHHNDRFTCSKAGYFLLNEQIVDVNIDFIHNVNYHGLYYLEEALLNENPEGLNNVFGKWDTISDGLLQLPVNVQNSWFRFNNYYSGNTFDDALQTVFANKPQTLLDVGGLTGNWALKCVNYDSDVQVTVIDLPQQIELMKQNTEGKNGCNRILGYGCNLLDAKMSIPTGFDAIWMSQLLDNFSEKDILNILSKISKSMSSDTELYIVEMFWDRQPFETGSFALTQISLYFNVLSTGKGKNYSSEEMINFIEASKLSVVEIKDGFGKGHSIIQCKKK